MSLIKFERTSVPTGLWQPTRNPSYGSGDPFEFLQPKDLSDGGDLYCYNKGLINDTFELVFNNMSETDYQNLRAFLRIVAVGAANNFVYTDENGVNYTVVCVTEKIDCPKKGYGRRQGKLELKKVG